MFYLQFSTETINELNIRVGELFDQKVTQEQEKIANKETQSTLNAKIERLQFDIEKLKGD